MPIIDDTFEERTVEEIQELLEEELVQEFGADIDLSESSVFSTIIRVLATVLAENQEADLADVYNAAFLETAEGIDLERVVAILGLSRRSAQHATGVQTFSREGKAMQTYVIQRGTIIQTDGTDPIQFETSASTNIWLYDNFESNDLTPYSGIPASFDINDLAQFVWEGTRSVEFIGSAGDAIYRTDKTTHKGKTLSVGLLPTATDAVMRQLFAVQNTSNCYYTEYDANADTHSIYYRDDGVDTELGQNTGVVLPDDEYTENKIEWTLDGEIVSILQDENENVIDTLTITDPEHYIDGGFGLEGGSTSTMYWDIYTSYQTSVNIRAVEGGADGNVASNTLIVLPNVPAGIEETTNFYPTGDERYTDISDETYRTGEDRETDEELRERTIESVSNAASSTADAILSRLRDLDGVQSVSIFENKTDTTDVDGQDPVSFEAVVLGGNDQEIAETIYGTKAATAHDVGGIRGTEITETVESSVNGQSFEISFSRQDDVKVEITMEIVVNDEYVGDNAIRDDIVGYIGGILSDDTTTTGLTTGEDVIIDKVEDEIVGDDNGVIGIVSISFTPTTTTSAEGLEVISIGDNEAATADATDGSIQITVNQI